MKPYFAVLNILLITATVYFSVRAFYQTVSAQLDHSPLVRTVSKGEASSENETLHPLSYYKPISERNLFNTKEKEEKPKEEVQEVQEELKETKLNLKLWGTVSGGSDKTYAVIEDTKKRKQNLYREGDMIQNAIVKKILREQIILSVNDKDEILKMEEKKVSKSSAREKARSRDKPAVKKRASSKNIKIERSEIEEAISDVNNLMKQARIRPHFKNGKPDGLTLTRIKRKSVFTKLGLKSGDIIMGVDGKLIESVDDGLKFYDSLKTSSNVELQIKRRGRTQTINYEIE